MNGKTRAVVVVVSAMLAVAAGNMLAGLLTLWRLKLSIPLEFGTWWQYARALGLPQLAPYAGAIRFAGYAAVFGRPDRGGDVVRAGAFAKALERAGEVPLPHGPVVS